MKQFAIGLELPEDAVILNSVVIFEWQGPADENSQISFASPEPMRKTEFLGLLAFASHLRMQVP